ncbi:hypothetical protein [Spirosoma jeollabukense]
MAGYQSVCVHLFDSVDKNFATLYRSDDGKRVNYMTTYKLLVPFGMSAGDVVQWIKQQIGPNKIHILRIVAHGDSGAFFLGKVYNEDNVYEWWTLRGYFDSAGRVELHSCAIASETTLHVDMQQPGRVKKLGKYTGNPNGQGVKFMRYLASAVNAKVVASIDDHFVGSNQWSLGKSAIQNAVTVYPNGTIQTQALTPMVPDPY